MNWFGDSWNTYVCDPKSKVPTPVHMFCAQCERPVLENDQGFVLPMLSLDPRKPDTVILHLDCFLHNIGALPCDPKFHPPTKETLS